MKSCILGHSLQKAPTSLRICSNFRILITVQFNLILLKALIPRPELYFRNISKPKEIDEIKKQYATHLHSFGYDCKRRANLQLLDESTLAFVAGNMLVLLDIHTKEQRYIRSCSGGGIGIIMSHPSKKYVAVAEKGEQPNIIVYEYPSLRPYRILRGGTGQAYSYVDFNRDGTLLASVGSAPDYLLTLWDWRQEQVMLRSKAFSQDVYRVSFSPDNPEQLTTSGSGHIRFWKMANTLTGLKLQGILGRFGKTALTDIEGYVALPDGKVVSGSEWGNMLLWDGGLIKVEICRKEGRSCHLGTIQQFALDEGELMTIGADGAVRTWDFESIDTADSVDDSGLFEIEPMNEMIIGRNVSLSSLVKSSTDSAIWYAQVSANVYHLCLCVLQTQDPECLFSFHAGSIEGMDVSGSSHLMATTALDRTVRIYDFLSKEELTTTRFTMGGTSLTWAPHVVSSSESVLVVGFEDGVVRLLELYNPHSLHSIAGRTLSGNAELRLQQALKPHSAPVTAISYERSGTIMATGSVDCTVFFFAVGEKYEPIGFINVPGPVQCLQWAPQSHERNTLLVACQTGHVVEVEAPGPEAQNESSTFHLQNLPIKYFCFNSIKSRIKREAEMARRQAAKEKKRQERMERLQKLKEKGKELSEEDLCEEEKEDEEEELPPLYIPNPPSPLHYAFYSQPGAFWLSMGGYDAGYLYHCKFAEQQAEDVSEQRDDPFSVIPVQNTEHNPILTICFSSERQMLLCGMQDGSIRLFPLEAGELPPGSMQNYWALSVHDNQYGSIRQLRFSHDGRFVLSAGADGNIFTFRLLDQEEMERHQAKVPSPRIGLEVEPAAPDIEDPAAYSIETAKQKLELECVQKEAELRKQERRKKLTELQSQFQTLLLRNQSLPEHAQLQRTVHTLLTFLFDRLKYSFSFCSYAAKPKENCEDPEDVRAIRLATENMGDFKLKTAKDFTVPEHLRVNTEKKRMQLAILEEQIFQRKDEMNARVLALRDSKVALISQLHSLLRRLQTLQKHLPSEKRRPLPTLPTLLPEETPERKLNYSYAHLQGHTTHRDQVGRPFQEEGQCLACWTTRSPPEFKLKEQALDAKYHIPVSFSQMEESVWRFDAELRLLRDEKLRMDVQMKLADLQHVTLFQELQLLKEFEKRENTLQERLNTRVQEERELRSKLEECKQQLDLKKREVAKLQEKEKSLTAAFLSSLGENNKFTDFLTKVFKKKIKRVKKKEKAGNAEEEEDSDEDSHEGSDWGEDEEDEGSEDGAGALDDSVCPPNCDPELFKKTLHLREQRLDNEELLLEEKKTTDSLKKEYDSLVKKEKVVQSSLKAAEGELELFNREKHQKLSELVVVVPLILHQIEYLINSEVPSKMGSALVMKAEAVERLQERINELQQENQMRELSIHSRQQYTQLSHELTSMKTKIRGQTPSPLMMMKFGKLVDLEALQTLSGNSTLEEMRQESRVREAEYLKELKLWQDKVSEARQALTVDTKQHTERMLTLNSLLTQQKLLEDKLNIRQKNMGTQFQGQSQAKEEEYRRLQTLIQSQKDEVMSLRQEISVLSRKGGHILPPSQPSLPPIPTVPTYPHPYTQHTRTSYSMDWGQSSTSSHGVE
uniref:Cilia- and flagella-associated protein 44 n=1 Tax=Astyanax mexicanus TaxID=7994 RepID=A0A8B9KLV5_ASTMX